MKRRPESRRASQRYHNRLARQYDAVYDDAYWQFTDRLTWDAIKPYLPRNAAAACCDLGCGTGKWGLKLLKSGFAVTFVDHSPAMIEQTRQKLNALGAKAKRATLLVADIVDLSPLAADQFELILAMGDPLSICSDAFAAAAQMRRICKGGGIVIATADNKLAAAEYFLQRADLDGSESFLRTGRTRWLTRDRQEQFELTTFTPDELVHLFERSGFQVLRLAGKTILPIRAYRQILDQEGAFERLLRLEGQLAKDATSAARASHLQIVAKKI